MLIRRTSPDAADRAVAVVSRLYGETVTHDFRVVLHRKDGRVNLRGRIYPESSRSRGARRSFSGRRGRYACWHLHRDFFRALFLIDPDAVAVTSLATYTADTFEEVFPDTYRGHSHPWSWVPDMGSLCECGMDYGTVADVAECL